MTRSAPDPNLRAPAPDSREARLAEALRANLRRRKAARREEEADDPGAGAQPGGGETPPSP
ncbi:MAG: hypothetical protein JJU18_10745 [Oceanicaulis sp.]|nr:hypothetical protein [Oceanicaulis sp.]